MLQGNGMRVPSRDAPPGFAGRAVAPSAPTGSETATNGSPSPSKSESALRSVQVRLLLASKV